MAKGAQAPDLKAAFEKHREETEGQVERLDQVFEIFGRRAVGKTCPAIDGILEEGAEILDDLRARRHWMQACLPQHKRWNTMKSRATAR